jgi:hypothetical protein
MSAKVAHRPPHPKQDERRPDAFASAEAHHTALLARRGKGAHAHWKRGNSRIVTGLDGMVPDAVAAACALCGRECRVAVTSPDQGISR